MSYGVQLYTYNFDETLLKAISTNDVNACKISCEKLLDQPDPSHSISAAANLLIDKLEATPELDKSICNLLCQ
jgi:hypothetical protein